MRPPIDPRIAAREELATPLRYHLHAAPHASESLLERLLNDLGTFLERLFSARGGGSLGDAVMIVVLLVLTALVLYLAARFLAGVPRKRDASVQVEELAAERADAGLARRAFLAAERRDFVGAVRFLLRAAIAMLDLRGDVRDDASATIGELRREALARGEGVAVPFGRIASAYVSGVYAQHPVDESAWRQARQAYESLRLERR